MSELWTTDVTPCSYSNSSKITVFPGEIPLYERDCILLIDEANEAINTNELIQSLKEIKFDHWCTGPPQRQHKHRHKSSKRIQVCEELADIKQTEQESTYFNDTSYRSLQRLSITKRCKDVMIL